MGLTVEIITLLLALYATALSTYICFRQIKSEKPNVSVTVGWSHAGVFGEELPETPQSLELHAVNRGRRDVVITIFALEVPGFACITPDFLPLTQEHTKYDKYPIEKNQRLKYGEEVSVSFDYAGILELLDKKRIVKPLKICAVLGDSLGNYFCSSWIEIGG